MNYHLLTASGLPAADSNRTALLEALAAAVAAQVNGHKRHGKDCHHRVTKDAADALAALNGDARGR